MASLQKKTEKFTIVGMKFSLIMMERICFQSVVLSPNSRQMDSSASFTAAGGLAIERTSTRCCFFIDFTANHSGQARSRRRKEESCCCNLRGNKQCTIKTV
uniref:Uncharacterized protein n=1 Tax=Pelusios castaneus TaxID=367368 RepID=A0A8C8S700_9SAUR